jgi:alpha-D-ribose 1-methylphosphonate 5-triphosphate synthase subunit PhnH
MLKKEFKNQRNFRKIMDSFAYPGKINKIVSFEKYSGNLFPQTIDLITTLVDGEVSFYIYKEDKEAEEEIIIRTNAKTDNISEADYVVVGLDYGYEICDCLKEVKRGTLINPHTSGTLIIEVKEILDYGNISLTGPGIKDKNIIGIDRFDWIKTRNEVNSEFPIGVDIILIDEYKNLLCIPRTTKIEVGE